MAHRPQVKTTFESSRVIQPFYTGGSVSGSQDARIIATTLSEEALLTDLPTGEQLARIEGDGETITSLALTPNASHLIICSRSLSMRIFALNPSDEDGYIEPELLRTLKPHAAPVVVSAVDQTGTLVATGGADGVVKVWDIRGGYCTHTFHGHSGVISALRFFEVDPNSQETSSSSRKKKRKSGGADVLEEDSSTAGYRLASGGEDGKVRIWNLHKRKSESILDSHVSVVRSLDFSPTENALVSGSRDKTIIIWDAKTWKIRSTIPVLELVESTGFVDSGAFVYAGGENGRVRIWRTSTGKEVTEEQEAGLETEGIVDIIYHQGQSHLLSVQADQTFALYDLEPLLDLDSEEMIPSLPILRRISGTHDEIIDMAYLGSNKSLLALATNLEDIRIISVAEAPDTEASEDSNGEYFGSDVALLKGHEEIIICMDVDWSGYWLATGAKDNTARLWKCDPENNSFTCFGTFTGHAESLGAVSLPHATPQPGSSAYNNPLDSPPEFLVTGSQDKTVKRWNVAKTSGKTSKAVYTRKAHDRDINAIDTNTKSTLFASASQDKTVKIWSLESGETLGVLRGHKRGVWTVKFAPSEQLSVQVNGSEPGAASRGLILTGSGDKTVKVWSLADYSCLLTFEGHTNSILKVLWLPQAQGKEGSNRDKRGAQVVSAAADGLVKVWDIASGELSTTLDNHTDRVWALAVKAASKSPQPEDGDQMDEDGTSDTNEKQLTLVSGGGDGVITFWQDTTHATATASAQRETERVEQEQRLQNYMYGGQYREAITLALQLNQPGRLLSLFTSVAEEGAEPDSLTGKRAVDDVVASLADEQLLTLLLRIRDWNTNARTAPVAQRLLWAVVKSYPATQLADLSTSPAARTIKGGALRDVLDALRVYTERHLNRMQELVDESYLLDFTLGEMDSVVNGHA